MSTPEPTRTERLDAVDVLRGFAILSVVLVNNPASWDDVYRPVSHAAWNGLNFADLGPGAFLFVVGVSLALSLPEGTPLATTLRAARRGLLLVAIGLAVNFLIALVSPDEGAPTGSGLGERFVYAVLHLRVFGMLQRIGVLVAIGAFLCRLAPRRRAAVAILVLVVHGLLLVGGNQLLTGSTALEPTTNVAARLDRALVGTEHLMALDDHLRDPDGLLTTLATIFSVTVGTLAGTWLRRREAPLVERQAGLFMLGGVLLWVGSLVAWAVPPNRYLNTPSYSLMATGITCLVLASFFWAIAHRWWPWLMDTFAIAGRRSITVYLSCELVGRLFDIVPVFGVTLPRHVLAASARLGYSRMFGSLVWALALSVLATVLVRAFHGLGDRCRRLLHG